MSLELVYNLRHLTTRKLQTSLTVIGIALVIFVFTATLMLANGLRETLAGTGSFDNVIVLRHGARNEIQSGVTREHAAILLADPLVARLPDGKPLATSDCVVLVSLKKRADGQPSNVNVRGVGPLAFQVRTGVVPIAGRLPSIGTKEVMIGTQIHEKFAGTDIGQSLRLVGTDWPIVGIFDAGQSGFSSEIWGDAEILIPSFKRDRFSTVTFRLVPGANFEEIKNRIENDPRLSLSLKRESLFYEEQSEMLGKFISYLGTFISVIFSLGAVVGAMITMYGAVANRTREIGILRALGFRKRTVFFAFLKECVVLAFIGGIVGVTLASLMSFVNFATTNFSSFATVAFGFRLNLSIVLYALVFSVLMGLLGGALPAFRASRLKILDALRSL